MPIPFQVYFKNTLSSATNQVLDVTIKNIRNLLETRKLRPSHFIVKCIVYNNTPGGSTGTTTLILVRKENATEDTTDLHYKVGTERLVFEGLQFIITDQMTLPVITQTISLGQPEEPIVNAFFRVDATVTSYVGDYIVDGFLMGDLHLEGV